MAGDLHLFSGDVILALTASSLQAVNSVSAWFSAIADDVAADLELDLAIKFVRPGGFRHVP
jgi:hypothetical protein